MSEIETLTASEPYDRQVEKLTERLLAAGRKSGIPPSQFQVGLEYPGTQLEDKIAKIIVEFSKRASGIFTLMAAKDTGLVRDGWTIESDDPCNVDVAKLDYSYCPVKAGEGSINGTVLLERACGIGCLGFGKLVLDEQKAGRNVIPVELQGKIYIPLTRTILRNRYDDRYVPCLHWNGSEWCVIFFWLDDRFNSDARLVRPSE